MKTLRTLILLTSMLALTAGLSAQTFEGKIRLKMTGQEMPSRRAGSDSPMLMTYFLKGGLMRVDMEMSEGKVMGGSIIDPVKHEVIILMPEQKMYIIRKMPEQQQSAGAAAPGSDVDFVRTGQTEMILGYKCEKIIVKSKNGETEIWGAEGLGTFKSMGSGGPMGRSAQKSAWETSLAQHGFFPLRMVNRDKSGKELTRMEAVSVDKQSLPDSIFAPPADYQQFQMPAIPGFGG
jgi:hypothetical protein